MNIGYLLKYIHLYYILNIIRISINIQLSAQICLSLSCTVKQKFITTNVLIEEKDNKDFTFQHSSKQKSIAQSSSCIIEHYLSMKLVVMNTIRASEDATPSRALRSPLKVSLPMPW